MWRAPKPGQENWCNSYCKLKFIDIQCPCQHKSSHAETYGTLTRFDTNTESNPCSKLLLLSSGSFATEASTRQPTYFSKPQWVGAERTAHKLLYILIHVYKCTGKLKLLWIYQHDEYIIPFSTFHLVLSICLPLTVDQATILLIYSYFKRCMWHKSTLNPQSSFSKAYHKLHIKPSKTQSLTTILGTLSAVLYKNSKLLWLMWQGKGQDHKPSLQLHILENVCTHSGECVYTFWRMRVPIA